MEDFMLVNMQFILYYNYLLQVGDVIINDVDLSMYEMKSIYWELSYLNTKSFLCWVAQLSDVNEKLEIISDFSCWK